MSGFLLLQSCRHLFFYQRGQLSFLYKFPISFDEFIGSFGWYDLYVDQKISDPGWIAQCAQIANMHQRQLKSLDSASIVGFLVYPLPAEIFLQRAKLDGAPLPFVIQWLALLPAKILKQLVKQPDDRPLQYDACDAVLFARQKIPLFQYFFQ